MIQTYERVFFEDSVIIDNDDDDDDVDVDNDRIFVWYKRINA